MRKWILFLVIFALLLFSGCNLINPGGGSKPSPSASEEASPKPTPKPSPSAEAVPQEESAKPSHTNGNDLFGGDGPFPGPSETEPDQGYAAVQDAQIRTYDGESLCSRDDTVYTESTSIRADYDGDGTSEILKIDFLDGPDSDAMNNPLKITLTIGDSAVVYENTWNDGVAVGIADYDTSDPALDIYILSLGTDVSAGVTTYRYDGSVIEMLTRFDIIADTAFWYDTQGYLYYMGQYEDALGVMVGLNYDTGEVFTVE